MNLFICIWFTVKTMHAAIEMANGYSYRTRRCFSLSRDMVCSSDLDRITCIYVQAVRPLLRDSDQFCATS